MCMHLPKTMFYSLNTVFEKAKYFNFDEIHTINYYELCFRGHI